MLDTSSKDSQVEKTERIRRNPLVYLNSLAIIISFFAMICLPLFPFAVWWYDNNLPVVRDFGLRFTSSSWFSVATLFLFFLFLLCLVMSVLLLLNSLTKITIRLPMKKLSMLGFIPSYAALTLTVTLTVVFIQYSIDRPWGLTFCFYSSLFCSLILMLLFIIQLKGESIFRRSAIVTQTGF